MRRKESNQTNKKNACEQVNDLINAARLYDKFHFRSDWLRKLRRNTWVIACMLHQT